MLCLVCVIIVRSLFGVSLNGPGGKSWGRQSKEHRDLDLTGIASMKNQIFYPTDINRLIVGKLNIYVLGVLERMDDYVF